MPPPPTRQRDPSQEAGGMMMKLKMDFNTIRALAPGWTPADASARPSSAR